MSTYTARLFFTPWAKNAPPLAKSTYHIQKKKTFIIKKTLLWVWLSMNGRFGRK